jgi:hypothetical protein
MGGLVTNSVLNNSDHPYNDQTEYRTILKKPLIITEANKNFTYEDMAIIEPYTTNLSDLNSFYDFVLIEATTDLQNWTILDKYDSRRFQEWLDEFDKGANATANDNLFKSQTISLTDNGFSIGQTIVFRFSLITDQAANSFGWAIKSIEGATASIEDVIKEVKLFSVYPTVSNGNFTIYAKSSLGKSKLKLVDITGKSVYESSLDFSNNEKQGISVNLNAGIYFVKLTGKNNRTASNKIIIK